MTSDDGTYHGSIWPRSRSTRAAGALASTFHAKATTATIRAELITVPARIARSARKIRRHLPQHWPWEHAWTQLFTSTCGPPGTTAP